MQSRDVDVINHRCDPPPGHFNRPNLLYTVTPQWRGIVTTQILGDGAVSCSVSSRLRNNAPVSFRLFWGLECYKYYWHRLHFYINMNNDRKLRKSVTETSSFLWEDRIDLPCLTFTHITSNTGNVRTYNVTLRLVLVTIIAVETSKCYKFRVCLCSLSSSMRSACARFYHMFFIKGMISLTKCIEHKMRFIFLYNFCLKHFWS